MTHEKIAYLQNLPQSLRDTAKWCLWRYEVRAGKKTKAPINPATRLRARANNQFTFASYHKALALAPEYDGLGIYSL